MDSTELLSLESSQSVAEKQLDLEDFEKLLKKRKRENSKKEDSSTRWVPIVHSGPIGEIIGGTIFDLVLPELDVPG